MSTRVIAPVAVVLLIVSIAAVGCGGGDSSAAPVSKADFIKEVNAVCTQVQQRVEGEFAQFVASLGGKEPAGRRANEAAQTKVANEILIPGKQQVLESLKELGPPKGDQARVEEIINALEDGIDTTEKDSGHAITNSGKTFAKEQVLAAKYGLKGC